MMIINKSLIRPSLFFLHEYKWEQSNHRDDFQSLHENVDYIVLEKGCIFPRSSVIGSLD